MKPNYTRVLRALSAHPWAILPGTLETICGIVDARVNGAPSFSKHEIRAQMGAPEAAAGMSLQGGGSIAVIPLVGVLAGKMNMFTDFSGGTSLDQFRSQFRRALADASVKGIVLAIDSPGGSVVGCEETWTEIMQARGQKPIVASVDALMASAALWIGSACDAIEMTPSGEAGSLGVFLVHEDHSAAEAAAGIKITYVASSVSPYKTEGNEDEPLSAETRAYLQSRVNQVASTFLANVAKGRRLSAATVEKTFGGGRTMGAADALAVKMIDRIATTEQTIARLASSAGRPQSGARGTVLVTQTSRAGVVPSDISEKLAPRDTPWEALTLQMFTSKSWDELTSDEKKNIARHFAWVDAMPPTTFGDCRLGHHEAKGGAVVFRGVTAALGRLDQTDLPAADKPKVKAHLEHHQQQFEKDDKGGARADHTDVRRHPTTGRFHAQCACSPMCACRAEMGDGNQVCAADCAWCQPDCPCLAPQDDYDPDNPGTPDAPPPPDPLEDDVEDQAANDHAAILAVQSGD